MNTPNPQTSPPRTLPPEEQVLVHDEAVVARAFRWSAIVAIVLGITGAALFWWMRRPAPAREVKTTRVEAPTLPSRTIPAMPTVRFTDVTAAAGIRFQHQNGARGEKLLPETMGGGVAFFDMDGDGDQDLLFVNSTEWPWNPPPLKPGTAALYRNDGTGHFEDITPGSGLDVSFYGMGVAAGDFDNDGRVDLFFSAVGQHRLFRNAGGGKFLDVTESAGLLVGPDNWTTACAWIDYDRDGDLDLFVGSYVRWSRAIDAEVGYKLVGIGRSYGQPMNFEGAQPYLYRNGGDGRFTEVAARAGLHVLNPATRVPVAKTLGVAPVDLDGDGWIDLVVANDTVQNFVFRNQRDGTFRELGALSGVAFDSTGQARGAMGIDTAYFREDATLGIAIGNFANEMTALYAARGGALLFTDEAIPEGIGPASRRFLKFGIFFFDYDLDGRPDLLSANGHLEDQIHLIQESQQYAQPAQLFWNTGDDAGPAFMEVSASHAGAALFQPIVGRGSAFGDIDGDGDPDVVLTQVKGPPLLLRNDQELRHAWVRLQLVGTRDNRDAIAARVRLTAGGRTILRQVMPTRSYLSQSELPVTIGLGPATEIDSLEVIWPSGQRQLIGQVRLNTTTIIRQEPASR